MFAGMAKKAVMPAESASGICNQKTARQPTAGSSAPAMMAPAETPVV